MALVWGGDVQKIASSNRETILLWRAIEHHDYPACLLAMENGADVAAGDPGHYGRSALCKAVAKGLRPLAELMAKSMTQAEIDLADQGGLTALDHAVDLGDCQTVEMLFKAGASVSCMWDKKGQAGASTLTYAAGNDRPEVIGLLLKLGADPLQVDGHGETALEVALRLGHKSVVELLLPVSDLKHRNIKTPRSMLMEACVHGITEAVEALVSVTGAEERDARGLRAIDLAVELRRTGRDAIIHALLPKSDPWAVSDGLTLLERLACNELGLDEEDAALAGVLLDAMAAKPMPDHLVLIYYGKVMGMASHGGSQGVLGVVAPLAQAVSERVALALEGMPPTNLAKKPGRRM